MDKLIVNQLGVNMASHPLNRDGIASARRRPQLLGQATKLPDIQTLREHLLRHFIPLDRAPGPRLEA